LRYPQLISRLLCLFEFKEVLLTYEPMVREGVFLRTHLNTKSLAHIWFLHGFGESSLSFKEAFLSELVDSYSLFVPDLPGFGVSPPQPGMMSVEGAVETTLSLINVLSRHKAVLLVGHSLGSVIATQVALNLGETVRGVFSIEGNLTRSDGYFSAQASEFQQADEFYRYFLNLIYKRAENSETHQRYLASVRFASPEAMMAWGRSSARLGGSGRHGLDFVSLKCQKTYYWSMESTPKETRDFIVKYNIPNRQYTGAGHWPMIETPDKCYSAINRFFASVFEQNVT
jgi:pimeloyl-ACP methyl ester carboxylesterase